jgi:hypothetical protein
VGALVPDHSQPGAQSATPMATAVQILPGSALRLKSIALNRNVSEAVRQQAYRLSENARSCQLSCTGLLNPQLSQSCHNFMAFRLTRGAGGCTLRLFQVFDNRLAS